MGFWGGKRWNFLGRDLEISLHYTFMTTAKIKLDLNFKLAITNAYLFNELKCQVAALSFNPINVILNNIFTYALTQRDSNHIWRKFVIVVVVVVITLISGEPVTTTTKTNYIYLFV